MLPSALRVRLRRSGASILVLAALSSTALTPVARAAEFPAVIPLSSLDGKTGFRIDGVAAGDRSGRYSSGARVGDVNGDGFGDVIVGANGADPHGSGSGSSYVVFGKASGFGASLDLSSLDGTNGFRLDGVAEEDRSGRSVAGADVNGDGFADIVIGAWRADPHGTDSGSVYVVFGRASGFAPVVALSSLNGNNGFRLDGAAAYDRTGDTVASAGDVNGDGFTDLIVAARYADPHGSGSGSTYVVFGRGSGFAASLDLSALDGSDGFRLDGVAADDQSGRSVDGAGDLNGDGFADVIVGARFADPNGASSGSTYVVFGKATGFAAAINLSSLNGANGFRLDGAAEFDISGDKAAGAGDVNGDGFADVIVGARLADPNGENSGSSYVVFGKAAAFPARLDLSALNGRNGFRLDGVAVEDRSGYAVNGAGDVNGDGFADLVVSAEYADPHGASSGSSYVVFGKASAFAATINLSTLNGANGFRLDGAAFIDFSGDMVCGGDVNGDGLSDVIVGAPYANGLAGATYVVFGRPPDTARTRIGAAADQYISGGRFADTLAGLAGDDRLEGRNGPDDLDGGFGRDWASYAHARPGVAASLAQPFGNTGAAQGDRYASIENLQGSAFADQLTGNRFANSIDGGKGGGLLRGLDGDDRLVGGPGQEVMIGGPGFDVFAFETVADSAAGAARDRILDFSAGSASTFVDRIDLSAIDAKTGPGNQAFNYIGTAAFTGASGELRVRQAGATAIVAGDVNGDAVADFEIALLNFTNLATLTAIDFRR
jgi:hypothetical protein